MAIRNRTVKSASAGRSAGRDGAKGTFDTRGGSLGLNAGTAAGIIFQISRGFPFRCLETFRRATSLPVDAIATAAGLAPRTLSRRRAAGRFRPDESERLLRISTVFEEAVNLFGGDRPAALDWLQSPQPALGGAAPLDFARTEVGAGEVRDLMGRLAHGVFT